jgi:large repetitive protein
MNRLIAAALVALAWSTAAAQAPLAAKVDGPPLAVVLKDPTKPLSVGFTAVAGQAVGIGITGLSFQPASASSLALRVIQPDGAEVIGAKHGWYCKATRAQGRCDGRIVATKNGKHTLIVEGPFSASARFQLVLSTPVSRELTAAKPEAITIPRPGQDASLGLELKSGEQLTVHLADVAPADGSSRFPLRIYRPDGALVSEAIAAPNVPAAISLDSGLPRGRYRIEVDPEHAGTGSFVVSAKAIARMQGQVSELAASAPGQEQRVTFQGRRGQYVTVGIESMLHTPAGDSNTYSMLSIIAPDGKRFAYKGCKVPSTSDLRFGPCRFHVKALPDDGSYTVVVRPPQASAVSGRLHVVEEGILESALPGPMHFDLTRPGQVMRMRFEGKAGERMGLTLSGAKYSSKEPGWTGNMVLYRPPPNDEVPWRGSPVVQGRDRTEILPSELPDTGTYTLLIDPMFGTFSGDLTWTR